MEQFTNVLKAIDDFAWGLPLIILILATGIFLTIRLRLVQIRRLPRALKFMVKNEADGKGEVSSFGALCTALSATIGTGNIVGVATALVEGGPGALFWMWIAAFFGMATKYAEGVLAIKYRQVDANGHVLGGPFYYIEKGMGHAWKWMAMLFAFFGVCVGLFGIGTFTQTDGIATAVSGVFDPESSNVVFSMGGKDYTLATCICAVVVAFLVGLVVIGGIKRIAKVSEIVVPFMAVTYIVIGLAIIVLNLNEVGPAFGTIIRAAFNTRAVAGGATGAMIVAMQKGIARGIFSNEAGLGSAPIAAAAAQTNSPARQGLVSMTGTFIDTIIVCTITGLSIVMTGAWDVGKTGVEVTKYAFAQALPLPADVSGLIVTVCLVFFGFTTILGWDYYSERCLEYMSNGNMRVVKIFRWFYILAVLIGPFMTLEAVWKIADIFNAAMALPNLIALLVLNGVVKKETQTLFTYEDAKVFKK